MTVIPHFITVVYHINFVYVELSLHPCNIYCLIMVHDPLIYFRIQFANILFGIYVHQEYLSMFFFYFVVLV